MKQKQLGRIIISALLITTLMSSIVFAATPRSITIIPYLSFSGETAICSVEIAGNNSSDNISATIKLWQGNRYIKTWNVNAIGNLDFSKSASVTKGNAYKLTVDATINGIQQATASHASFCPN